MALAADTKVILIGAAVMFLAALLLGVWKYRQILASEKGTAHPYMDIAHRAALLYSFALLLIASFVQLSGWSELVNLIAAGALTFYFFAAVGGYTLHGWRRDTDNQFRNPTRAVTVPMLGLIIAEIGGWLILMAGFMDKQIF